MLSEHRVRLHLSNKLKHRNIKVLGVKHKFFNSLNNKTMKNYFTDKLKKSKESINRLEKRIIEAATNMEMKALLELPKQLQTQREEHSEWNKDCAKYLSIDDLIEISNLTDKYSNESLNLINNRDIEYHFKYNSNGISITDRDKLIARFGYSLKEAKVK